MTSRKNQLTKWHCQL